jgi:hypothetical protein
MNLNYRPLDYHEHKARKAKAEKLARVLQAIGVPAWKATLMTDEQWRMTAQAARCHPPSDDRTKTMVFGILEEVEYAAAHISVRQWKEKTKYA